MNGREQRLSSLLSTGATPLAPASSFARSIQRGSSTSFDSTLSAQPQYGTSLSFFSPSTSSSSSSISFFFSELIFPVGRSVILLARSNVHRKKLVDYESPRHNRIRTASMKRDDEYNRNRTSNRRYSLYRFNSRSMVKL